jgi:hypothetical protein
MEKERLVWALEEVLRGQSGLVEACARRAVAARDPRLKSAWIGAVVRLMDASAVTGSAIAAIQWAPTDAVLFQLPICLCLPNLPPLPEGKGGTPSPSILQNNLRWVFQSDQRFRGAWFLPRKAGEGNRRAKHARACSRRVRWEGAKAGRCPPRRLRRHSPRCAGGEPRGFG